MVEQNETKFDERLTYNNKLGVFLSEKILEMLKTKHNFVSIIFFF